MASHTYWHAQVKDWGEGQPADLGELQVESFTPGLYADHSKPFYEQLARRLEDLQVNCSWPNLPLLGYCTLCWGTAVSRLLVS